MILNIRNFSTLKNSEFIRANRHFFKIGVNDEENVRTYKILGSLEILAIKNTVELYPLIKFTLLEESS